jgi:hypothetical protein
MAWKVDEAANIVFVQLIAQEPGIYILQKHPNYARRNKILWHVNALPGNGSIDTPRFTHATVEHAVFSVCPAAGVGAVTLHINIR